MAQLDWKEAATIKVNHTAALINRASLDNGNVFHSIRLSRCNEDGKHTQFLRSSDLDDLEELAAKVRYWIQADIDEIRSVHPSQLARPILEVERPSEDE